MFKSSPSQSLGFQIASATAHDGEGRVFFFVKQINAEPAISANLHVDDIILSVSTYICILLVVDGGGIFVKAIFKFYRFTHLYLYHYQK